MIVVIIAGGSGTRLWPLSTPEYPKHLLRINDDKKSLLQHTYDRAKKLSDSVYVVSEAGHIDYVKQQLKDLPHNNFIVEPARRGTASCILAALVQISREQKPDDSIAVLAADHYIRDTEGFIHSFKIASETSAKEKRIVLVGVEPEYPATGFGYIKKENVLNDEEFVYNVHSFKEKPEFDVARQYVKSGNYLWNCGYFVGSLNTFISNMQRHAPELYKNYLDLLQATKSNYEEIYLSFETNAIDYALNEKVPDLLVVPASFDWMDIGSFRDLHRAVGGDEFGNSMSGPNIETEEVENSLIYNHEEKPVAVIGLDNVVVINTAEGLLVARKDLSQKVGDVSKRFKRPE